MVVDGKHGQEETDGKGNSKPNQQVTEPTPLVVQAQKPKKKER